MKLNSRDNLSSLIKNAIKQSSSPRPQNRNSTQEIDQLSIINSTYGQRKKLKITQSPSSYVRLKAKIAFHERNLLDSKWKLYSTKKPETTTKRIPKKSRFKVEVIT